LFHQSLIEFCIYICSKVIMYSEILSNFRFSNGPDDDRNATINRSGGNDNSINKIQVFIVGMPLMLISTINELDWNLNKIKKQTHIHAYLCKHMTYYTYIDDTYTQRLIGVVSTVLNGRRIIYACQLNVATKSAKWSMIEGTRISFPFEKRSCVMIRRARRTAKGKQRENEERMLTKCNDYRFQCNIL